MSTERVYKLGDKSFCKWCGNLVMYDGTKWSHFSDHTHTPREDKLVEDKLLEDIEKKDQLDYGQ